MGKYEQLYWFIWLSLLCLYSTVCDSLSLQLHWSQSLYLSAPPRKDQMSRLPFLHVEVMNKFDVELSDKIEPTPPRPLPVLLN